MIFIQTGIAQIVAFIVIMIAKLLILFSVMKNIEKIKHISYLLIFIGGLVSYKLDISSSKLLK
jgi:hypothetical protein